MALRKGTKIEAWSIRGIGGVQTNRMQGKRITLAMKA
jgi:hypothetical protein